LNQKIAKALRQVAGYRNESATPSPKMPFPGVARMYQHPVFYRRQHAVKTFDPKARAYTHTQKSSPVLDRRGKPRQIIDLVHSVEGDVSSPLVPRPRMELVPVPKPGRLGLGPKRWYRSLKRHVHVHGLRKVNDAIAEVMEWDGGKPRLDMDKLNEVLA